MNFTPKRHHYHEEWIREIHGMTYAAIAAELKISISEVREAASEMP